MSRVAVYSGPYQRMLHGLGAIGANPICLDQNQNAIDCSDPNCTYGDCGATSSYVPSGGCLDQNQNQILCADPNCTYGDCLPATPAPAAPVNRPGTIGVPAAISNAAAQIAQTVTPRPSPTVAVPLSLNSAGMFLTGSTLITGIPNLAVIGGGLLVIALALGGGGRRR